VKFTIAELATFHLGAAVSRDARRLRLVSPQKLPDRLEIGGEVG
jgi:hypothetical protein